jgi:hypothetical protein
MSATLATVAKAGVLPVDDFDQTVLDQLISAESSLKAYDKALAAHHIQRDRLTDEIMLHAAVQFGLGKIRVMSWYVKGFAALASRSGIRDKLLYLESRRIISLKTNRTDLRSRQVIPSPLCLRLCALRVRLLYAQPIGGGRA